jgi:hypothetical protein
MIIFIIIICDTLQFILTHLLTYISKIQGYVLQLNIIDVQDIQLRKLRVQQSVLTAQRDLIQHQLDSTTVTIDSIVERTARHHTTQIHSSSNASASSDQQQIPLLPLSDSTPQQSTVRRRCSRWHYKVGEPYPLPYTPPRTPEEQRRNNIIAWVNELRSQASP